MCQHIGVVSLNETRHNFTFPSQEVSVLLSSVGSLSSVESMILEWPNRRNAFTATTCPPRHTLHVSQRCTIAPVHWHRKSRTIIRVRRPRQSECNVMMTGIVDLQLAEIRARTTGEERRGLSTQMTLYKGRLFRVTANPPLQGKAVRAPVALQTFSIGSTFYLLLHQPKSSPCCRFFHMDEPTSST